jgi:O-acetylserine/cysteine efflux transporter
MKGKDLLLALLVVTVWGSSFTVIRLGLDDMPPLLLAALRFGLAAVPAVFFIRRPVIPLKYLLAYGATVGVGQFGCMFYAMHLGLPAGLASVVLQSQAFFTLLLAAFMLHEKVLPAQLAGLALAALGLLLIGAATGEAGTKAIPPLAMLLALTGATFWGISNIVIRKAVQHGAARTERLDMFSLTIWSSLIPPIPLLLMGLMLHSPAGMLQSLTDADLGTLLAVCFLAFAATVFGFGTWSKLLSRYPTSQVAPLSLMVPVTGLFTASIVLGERLVLTQWLGCLLILGGLAVAIFGQIRFQRATEKRVHPDRLQARDGIS